MEDYQKQWNECREKMRQYLHENLKDGDWVYETWIQPVAMESYDPKTKALLLRIPSHYVYEYLEHCQIRLMQWALNETFRKGWTLQYRILANADGQAVNILQDRHTHRLNLAVPDARDRIQKGLRHFVGDKAQWLPAYDEVAAWLSDNKGRGLLCLGTPGLGKSLLCRDILPVILNGHAKVCDSVDMGSRIDELLSERCIVIDDLGKDSVEAWVKYKKRKPFFELCNAAEKDGKLLIITTNLSTTPVSPKYRYLFPMSIQERYGAEVLDRLKAVTRLVKFDGKSMRNL